MMEEAAMVHHMQQHQQPPPWVEYPYVLPYSSGPTNGQTNGLAAAAAAAVSAAKMAMSAEEREGQWRVGPTYAVAPMLNSKGLPLRVEETECAFYLKNGRWVLPAPSMGEYGVGIK